jgi:pimeloyl-ACP methyl ester carboxylesterase
MLLIIGFRTQLIGWDEAFCQQLADRGFHVIRYDNRDVGLSSKLEGGPRPDLKAALGGDFSSVSYGLEDMAKDAVGLLDALGIGAAHIAGASMGGMIAQLVAILFPERTLSLCSIMSSTGDRSVGQPAPGAMQQLLLPTPESREKAIEAWVNAWRIIGSTGYPFDEAALRLEAGRAYDRCFYPPGVARQMLAILSQKDRTPALAGVTAPTLVIHGEVDPLVTPSGGEATARAVPGAKLLMIPGMGHDLPQGTWPIFLDAMAENARRGREPRAKAS